MQQGKSVHKLQVFDGNKHLGRGKSQGLIQMKGAVLWRRQSGSPGGNSLYFQSLLHLPGSEGKTPYPHLGNFGNARIRAFHVRSSISTKQSSLSPKDGKAASSTWERPTCHMSPHKDKALPLQMASPAAEECRQPAFCLHPLLPALN